VYLYDRFLITVFVFEEVLTVMSSMETFRGRIGFTHEESIPHWDPPPASHDGKSPNVLLVLLDDTGFGNLGCFGSTIETPNMDRLSENGLRYSNFHVTPICSPTRASLLTGRNHHSVGMGFLATSDTGYPNLRGLLSRNSATLAEMLRDEGYSTFALGKWHLNPGEHNSAAGPRNGWPLQRGFDRYYGFLSGATDQYYPELTYDNHPVYPPKTPEEGYHVTEDLVDRAIGFISDQKSIYPNVPFFMYFAPGAMHFPHQVPKKYIEKYKGRFDVGWDVIRQQYFDRQLELGIIPEGTKLPPRNPGVKAWEEFGENEKKFMCRLQETWAGFLDHTDEHLGRLIDYLASINQLDNTVIILTADNGTSQDGGPYGAATMGPWINRSAMNNGETEGTYTGDPPVEEDVANIDEILDDIGGPKSYADIPWGWSQVGNTPAIWYKHDTHGGGVRVPLIVQYPEGIKDKGGIRDQFHYVNDIAPTILDMLGIEAKATYGGYTQMPISGTSLAYTYEGKDIPTQKPIQYFEMQGKRALWYEGWKAVTRHQVGDDYFSEQWELYHLDEDFSESTNLAEREPERLTKMIDLWWAEAGKYGVLPLYHRDAKRFDSSSRPGSYHENGTYHFPTPISHIPIAMSPRVGEGDWSLKSDIEILDASTEGVICAYGSYLNGFSFFVKDRTLHLAHNVLGTSAIISSDQLLPDGRLTASVSVTRLNSSESKVTFSINSDDAGIAEIPVHTNPSRVGGLDIGQDVLCPITDVYQAPFKFTGKVHSVDFIVE